MKTQIVFISVAALIFVTCATLSQAQWTPDPFCEYPSNEIKRYRYYGNCSVWWECFEGSKYIMECPDGLEFNEKEQQCDDPSIANCDPYAPTTGNPNPPTYTTIKTTSHLPPPNCPFPSEDLVYFPYPGDCNKYWECYEGEAYLYNCPEHLWWHQEISQCDYPGPFCTDNGSTVTTKKPTTPSGAPTCPDPNDVAVFFPYPGDCTKYWECFEGSHFVLTCPAGNWWHPAINACDRPGSYCDNSGTTRPPPTTSSVDCPATGTSYLPDPDNCHLFIMCRDGTAYPLECQDGLYYSAIANACVQSNESECCVQHGCP